MPVRIQDPDVIIITSAAILACDSILVELQKKKDTASFESDYRILLKAQM